MGTKWLRPEPRVLSRDNAKIKASVRHNHGPRSTVAAMSYNNDILVFAYGSNLHVGRMRARAPGAETVAIGYVTGRQFHFHKRSTDGSAKADAFRTGQREHRVWGVVYRIDSDEKAILDQHENLGIGYDEELVEVNVPGTSAVWAWIYTARSTAIAPALRPYTWYLDFVLFGALQNRLPLCYIAQLRNARPKPDPDSIRHQRNHQLVASQSVLRPNG